MVSFETNANEDTSLPSTFNTTDLVSTPSVSAYTNEICGLILSVTCLSFKEASIITGDSFGAKTGFPPLEAGS
ncbi:hypothetical protein D3C80_1896280 [compost metagenome]